VELLDLVKSLPDAVMENEYVDDWLFWCVTNHLKDHAI
jgi:hypothetical protein